MSPEAPPDIDALTIFAYVLMLAPVRLVIGLGIIAWVVTSKREKP